jgi:hypothetical protein
MDSYNKSNINIAGGVTTVCVVVGMGLYFFTHNYMFFNAIFIPVGLTAIIFSHDLAMRDFSRVKLNPNYKLYRGAYIVTGIIFILLSLAKLTGH